MKRQITAALLCASLVFVSTAVPVHAKALPPHKSAPQKYPPKLPRNTRVTLKSHSKTTTSAGLLKLTAKAKLLPLSNTFGAGAITRKFKFNPGGLVSLNPQPLPPEPPAHDLLAKLKTTKRFKINPGSLSSLNPQPLPPHEIKAKFLAAKKFRVNPGSLVSLNPQPLPPEPPPHKIQSRLKVVKGF